MGLFSQAQVSKINDIAAKSKEALEPPKSASTKSINDELNRISQEVLKYFPDSPAKLITSKWELHEYIDKCIEAGYVGFDTETTGLDRIRDSVVGCSIYYPGGVEVYIPSKHKVPIFETYYKDQLSYEEVGEELQRLVDASVKMIFANADFDIAMSYKDYGVDLIPIAYYDVILAWRCLKEDEKDNSLKGLYAKYPKRGKVDPKKFSDFFPPSLFPYCKPEIAKLYAANDAKITFDLFLWQLPYVTPNNEKCKKAHLEKIADLIWKVEIPMIRVCALLHRNGVELDSSIVTPLHERYEANYTKDVAKLQEMVQVIIDENDTQGNTKRPFRRGADFNPNSTPHVKYLVNNLLGKQLASTGKEELKDLNMPVADQILKVRGAVKLMGTYVDKMPRTTAKDGRIHCSFKSIGAATGRMSSQDPRLFAYWDLKIKLTQGRGACWSLAS